MAALRLHPTIIMTPPTQHGASSSPQHPRRRPADQSVSLLHSPRRRAPQRVPSGSSSDSVGGSLQQTVAAIQADSPSSLAPLGRGSSGQSSNAEKWFEESNNELRDHRVSYVDNEPPFFMRNSSSETPPEVQPPMRQFLEPNDGSHAMPPRTGLPRPGTDGGSTEDYRSVIDDLTIENKKLKKRLKKYEKLHDSHLKNEKLFEVRIHGLPPAKKRELEDTLRKFAVSLGTGFPADGYKGLLPMLKNQKPASSQMSLQPTDSAYASMSASGQGSSAQSGSETKLKCHGAGSSASRHQTIHSYLHHIPEGLLPQSNPATMTERAKQKLVARRLEQVFSGNGAAAGGHQHPLQQQEVSHMAARADRAAIEAGGQRSRQEGIREAHMMLREVEDPADPSSMREDGNTSPEDESYKVSADQTTNRGAPDGTLDQRPTRPLDLDPYRAQIPTENIEYMRHLGFSPPDPHSEKSPEEGHGWVYLNLLINMAQLHTINVTAEFVRKALAEYSTKFELSPDGRKARWKGGVSTTRTSSRGSESPDSRGRRPDTQDIQSPRKRPKLSHHESHQSIGSRAAVGKTERSRLVYTPLFFHRDSSEDADDWSDAEDDTISSPFPAHATGNSSGMTSSGVRTNTTKKHKEQDDGPIIFYNNARFCTDLSGDRDTNGNTNAPPYTAASSVPVGKSNKTDVVRIWEKKGPLAAAVELPEPMDVNDNPIPASMELSFPHRSPARTNEERCTKLVELEVTGIGGVWPADNFAIEVESRHARVYRAETSAMSQEASSKYIPARLAQILQEAGPWRRERAVVHQQVVQLNRRDLAPSELPSALSFMPSEESTGDDDCDSDDMSVSPDSPDEPAPSAAPQPADLYYSCSDEEDDESDSVAESDSSLDLLAAARQLDPDAIREREREYDANMAERLAEEIPSGTSAATAGGGSGFASPASPARGTPAQHPVPGVWLKPSGLKRARSSDSLKVQNPEASSSDGADDMDVWKMA